MVSITLEGLWMVSDKIFDFQFFIKFHMSGPAIILNYYGHVSYGVQKLSKYKSCSIADNLVGVIYTLLYTDRTFESLLCISSGMETEEEMTA